MPEQHKTEWGEENEMMTCLQSDLAALAIAAVPLCLRLKKPGLSPKRLILLWDNA